MLTFIVRRVISGIVLIIVISVVAFALLYLDSDNIARNLLGQNATAELVAQKAAELGLDRPIIVQYWDWLTSAITGDFGRSWFNGQLVVGIHLRAALAVTLSLVIGTTLSPRSSRSSSASSPRAAAVPSTAPSSSSRCSASRSRASSSPCTSCCSSRSTCTGSRRPGTSR